MTKQLTARQFAEQIKGRLDGNPEVVVTGVESLEDAAPHQLSFLGNPKYADRVVPSNAGIVLVPEDFSKSIPDDSRAWIYCENPSAAFSKAVEFFAPPPVTLAEGVHATAAIAPNTELGENVAVGPHAVIAGGAKIGAGSIIGAGAYIGHETTLGKNCIIYPNVTIRERCKLGNRVAIHSGTVIGSDGFGYIPGKEGHKKIPQVGIVQIDDDVEIGSNVAIDRARFGRTWIKTGAKIDNLVQIAHNVVIGELSFVVAQVGISGSTRIGKGVSLAGQAGITGHLEIGDGAVVMAQSGLNKDLPPGAIVVGAPARDRKQFARDLFAVGRIPKLTAQIKTMQQEIKRLEEEIEKLGRH